MQKSYGIRERNEDASTVAAHVEQLKLLGYCVLDSGFSDDELEAFSRSFEDARARNIEAHGRDFLESIDEQDTIRAPLSHDRTFLKIARHRDVLAIAEKLTGGLVVLNQQNGVINPANSEVYNQGYYHRDLPYQHFVSSRPLALNALFCLDDFTIENGATKVIPGSHKQEAFPLEQTIASTEVQVVARRGSYIILDCMTYHSGGQNRTAKDRRAVNNVYSIPFIKQQISLPALLGLDFAAGDDELARFLGYGFDVPTSVRGYYKTRRTLA